MFANTLSKDVQYVLVFAVGLSSCAWTLPAVEMEQNEQIDGDCF